LRRGKKVDAYLPYQRNRGVKGGGKHLQSGRRLPRAEKGIKFQSDSHELWPKEMAVHNKAERKFQEDAQRACDPFIVGRAVWSGEQREGV